MADRHHNLSLTLISPEDLSKPTDGTVFDGAPPASGFLRLEQEEEYIDVMQNSPCIHSRLIVGLRVYHSGVEYQLQVSWGELSDEFEQVEEEVTESFFINLESELDLSREGAMEVIAATWEGTVRDSDGNIVPNPPTYGTQQSSGEYQPMGGASRRAVGEMVFENGVLSWGVPLHGTLRVTFLTGYDRWQITLFPRDTLSPYDPEAYQSTVSAFYEGRAENLELSIDFDCGGSKRPPDPDEPDEQCIKRWIDVDPCTNEPTGREWDEIVPCPNDDDEPADDDAPAGEGA